MQHWQWGGVKWELQWSRALWTTAEARNPAFMSGTSAPSAAGPDTAGGPGGGVATKANPTWKSKRGSLSHNIWNPKGSNGQQQHHSLQNPTWPLPFWTVTTLSRRLRKTNISSVPDCTYGELSLRSCDPGFNPKAGFFGLECYKVTAVESSSYSEIRPKI